MNKNIGCGLATADIYGNSSVGRATVSKTVGREFEPYFPCYLKNEMKKYKVLTDLEESYNELVHKVSWPTKSELANSTVVVMVASIVIALIILLMDQVVNLVMHFIYGIPSL